MWAETSLEKSLNDLERPDEHRVSVLVYYATEDVGGEADVPLLTAVGALLAAFDLELDSALGPFHGSLLFWFRASS